MANDSLVVFERPNPFEPRSHRSELALVPQQPLARYLATNDATLVTYLDGKLISPAERQSIIPRPGQQLVIGHEVGGGGGKSILRALAMVAVMVISVAAVYFLGPAGAGLVSGLWAAVIGGAISIGGSLLINALLGPPGLPKTSQNYGWNGASMTAQAGLPVPIQAGTLLRAPNVIESYLSTTLTQQWLNILLDFGWGPAQSITQIKINGNPITNYPGVWTDVRLGYNDQAPLANFSDIVESYAQDVRLISGAAGFTLIGTGLATQAAEFEFYFPSGLWIGPDGDGNYEPWQVWLQVSYRLVGSLNWSTILTPRTTAGLPVNAQNQAPYWIAVTSQWSPNQNNTTYVLAVDYTSTDHSVGQAYSSVLAAPVYDSNGNPTGTQNITLTGTWQINPAGPGAASSTNAGSNYVTITDYASVSATCTWNRPTPCRDVVRIDNLPPGQYEYMVSKVGSSGNGIGDYPTTSGETNPGRGEQTWFTALREITYQTLSYPNKVLLAIRALATNTLSGTLNVTAVVQMASTPAMGYKNEIGYDQPEAYYRMDDNSDAACVDLTGHGHTGVYVGAPVLRQPGLIVGSPSTSAQLALTDSITIAAPAAFTAGAWAAEIWFQTAMLGASFSAPAKLISSADGTVYLALDSTGKLNFHFSGADNLTTAIVANGVPHHVAFGATPGGFLVMVDGVGQFFPSLTPPAWSPAQLGGGFAGLIDEAAFYTYGIQPGRLKSHYVTGTIGLQSALENRSPSNPAMVVIDALANPLYGGQQSPSQIDVPAFTTYADFCDELVSNGQGGQIYRHIFNGVFDQATQNLWSAIGQVGVMSRTVMLRTGTMYSCVCEAPATPTQMFTMGNIKANTFKESWPSLMDRANCADGRFPDETNSYVTTPVRVMDEAAIAAGAMVNNAGAVSLFGITNPSAAWRMLTYLIDAAQAALPMASIDCALEGIAARLGDVVIVQHDVPQWQMGGRTLGAVSASQVKLDQTVTLAPGVTYVLMIVFPAVERAAGTIVSIGPNFATVATAWDGTTNVSRLLCNGQDIRVTASSVSGGVANLTLASTPEGWAADAPCQLYDVDVIETQTVSTPAGESNVLTVSTPFSAPPAPYSLYVFGVASELQYFRISAIGRRSDQEMSLQLTAYNPDLYEDLEPMLPVALIQPNLIAVTNLAVVEAPNATPQFPVLAISWTPGLATAGARIYLSYSGMPEYLAADVSQSNATQLSVMPGLTYTVRVVGYNAQFSAAPYAAAPTVTIAPLGAALLPQNVAGFYASGCVAAARSTPASVALNWTANPSTDNVDHYEIYYGGTILNPMLSNSVRLTPNPAAGAASAAFSGFGPGQYLIIAVNTSGIQSATPTMIAVVVGGSVGTSGATGSTGTGGGGTGGDGGGFCFSGNVAIDTPQGWTSFGDLPRDRAFEIVNETGHHFAELLVHRFTGEMIDFTGLGELVTVNHWMKCGSGWMGAGEFYSFRKRVDFAGEVFNLHVLSNHRADQHYRLRNGDIAHNEKMIPQR